MTRVIAPQCEHLWYDADNVQHICRLPLGHGAPRHECLCSASTL